MSSAPLAAGSRRVPPRSPGARQAVLAEARVDGRAKPKEKEQPEWLKQMKKDAPQQAERFFGPHPAVINPNARASGHSLRAADGSCVESRQHGRALRTSRTSAAAETIPDSVKGGGTRISSVDRRLPFPLPSPCTHRQVGTTGTRQQSGCVGGQGEEALRLPGFPVGVQGSGQGPMMLHINPILVTSPDPILSYLYPILSLSLSYSYPILSGACGFPLPCF